MLEALGASGVVRGCELVLDRHEVTVGPGLACVRGKRVDGGAGWSLEGQPDGVLWVCLDADAEQPWQLREELGAALPLYAVVRTGGRLAVFHDLRRWLVAAVWCETLQGRTDTAALVNLGGRFATERASAATLSDGMRWKPLPLVGTPTKTVEGALSLELSTPAGKARSGAICVMGTYPKE